MFKDDELDGYGEYEYYDGSRYEGEWKNSLREGVGTLYYQAQKFEGFWKNDYYEGSLSNS